MSFNFKIFLFWLLLLSSCTQKDDGFSSYLKLEYEEDIPKSQHFYVLMPKGTCEGCLALNMLKAMPQVRNQSTAIMAYDTSNVRGFKEYRFDATNLMYSSKIIPLLHYFIVTEKGKVIYKAPLRGINQLDSFYKATH